MVLLPNIGYSGNQSLLALFRVNSGNEPWLKDLYIEELHETLDVFKTLSGTGEDAFKEDLLKLLTTGLEFGTIPHECSQRGWGFLGLEFVKNQCCIWCIHM